MLKQNWFLAWVLVKHMLEVMKLVNKETKFLEVDKARDVLVKENNKIKTYGTPYFNVTNIYGTVTIKL